MCPSPAASGSAPKRGGKRRRGRPASGSRTRKKQKRLDAICDAPASTSCPLLPDDEPALRRSSRVRRAPNVLDSSPVPSSRRKKKSRLGESEIRTGDGGDRRIGKKGRRLPDENGWEEERLQAFREKEGPASSAQEIKNSEVEIEDWKSRLRSRVGKGRGSRFGKGKLGFFDIREQVRSVDRAVRKEKVSVKSEATSEPFKLSGSEKVKSKKTGKKTASTDQVSDTAEHSRDQAVVMPSNDQGDSSEEASQGEGELKVVSEPQVDSQSIVVSELKIIPVANHNLIASTQLEEVNKEAEYANMDEKERYDQPIDEGIVVRQQELEDVACASHADIPSSKQLNDKVVSSVELVKEDHLKLYISDDKIAPKHIKEGRRCGLCGGGTDGKPPKRLVQEPSSSDHEAYEGLSASEEPNYNVWDGFGDEPGWLGRLLGPIRDRYGIARVWVHQHCAVWSPEVYFAGLGCLKNIRAALYRGRALKCSRCGRPGATIGCRVDRCPKTYHLPCSRAEGCIFDHQKFLIACNDHRHLFQPQGDDYAQLIKKQKVKKLKFDMRKVSHDAWRKDLEAEEKWLENCGEDEEFLKREGKRLHRDLLRIAPEYIGGSSDSEKAYQGWESVAGLQGVINCMKEVVILPLLYPEVFENFGLTPPRGVLLHGYPGTGKTLVVRALIGACSRGDKRIAYFARKGADCLGKYVGDAERQLRLLFQVAERSQPSIIFFDEIDGLAPCRSRHQDQTHNSVVSTLLSLLDGLKSRGSVIVIGATNRPDAVDPALRRPGRFDREIYFPLPMLKDRSDILSLHTKSWPNPLSGSLLSWIANQTAGYAGADLQALCTQAAMNALKRNCPLQELLSSAEECSTTGTRPSLPSFIVEERDWLAALAVAPPPCSRRAAGMTANDIISSPLHSHLVPCLLNPLAELLVSFYFDERIWLAPPLIKASKSVKNIIFSVLEQKSLPAKFWQSHLRSLIWQPCVANEIERSLLLCGLVIGVSGYVHSDVFNNTSSNLESCDSYRSKPSDICIQSKSNQESVSLGNAGFRALISGAPRSGQQHLASCLIHGFTGHIEIHKLNLATMLQEGHGDIIHGLTQILFKCLNMRRCIIYMPRMDLWAIDETLRKDLNLNESSPKSCQDSFEVLVNDDTKNTSEAWTLFVEQVDSMSASASISIVATCEMQIGDLPVGIKQFFTDNIPDNSDSSPSEHTIPRFLVDLDGSFNLNFLINSFATKLSEDLVQKYIELMHHRTHTGMHDEKKTFHSQRVSSGTKIDSLSYKEANIILKTPSNSKHTSTFGVSCNGNQNQQPMDGDDRWSLPKLRTNGVFDTRHNSHQDSFTRTLQNKMLKGSSMLAIATFGYQILRSPQFAELCWVTSKLREGPSTDTNGPWKGWPFNSCIIRPTTSPEKISSGVITNHRDREHFVTVRGLVAVGLLAYRGLYTSVREVSFEVRKVLELLVEQVRAKILGGKDRYCYLRILSQVAYLEDIVNSWAYTFRSLPEDKYKAALNAKPTFEGKMHVGNELNFSPILDNHSSELNCPERMCNEIQDSDIERNPDKSIADNGNSLNVDKEFAVQVSSISDVRLRAEFQHGPSATSLSRSCPSSLVTGAQPSEDGNFSLGRLPFKDDLNGLESTKSSLPPKGKICNLDSSGAETNSRIQLEMNQDSIMDHVLSSNDVELCNHEHLTATGLLHEKANDFVAASNVSCLYSCCSGCLHNVHVMVENILRDSWRSRDSCSKVDDVHDIFASCSLNLTLAIRNYYTPHISSHHEEFVGKEDEQRVQSGQCACKEFPNKQLHRMIPQHTSKKVIFLPTECSCHSDKTETENSDSHLLLQPGKAVLFKDGVQMPLNTQTDAEFHCKFEKLCLCSILEMILVNKQPID